MLNRRDLLLTGAAALTPITAAAPPQGDGQRLIGAARSGRCRTRWRSSPQLMTLTGLDTGPNAAAKHKLDDRSADGPERR